MSISIKNIMLNEVYVKAWKVFTQILLRHADLKIGWHALKICYFSPLIFQFFTPLLQNESKIDQMKMCLGNLGDTLIWSLFGHFLVSFWSLFGHFFVTFWSLFCHFFVTFWSLFGHFLVTFWSVSGQFLVIFCHFLATFWPLFSHCLVK